jgi:hypothetical protein
VTQPQGAVAPPSGSSSSPPTPTPELGADEVVPDAATSPYPANRPQGEAGAQPPADGGVTPSPAADDATADPNAALEAPQLLNPRNDLRANRPTVDVHHAVYRQAAATQRVSPAAARTTVKKTQAEIDAEGWYSVPRSR